MIVSCREIDEQIFKTFKKLDYQKYLTPRNFNEENAKFLEEYNSGFQYNPQYSYLPFSSNKCATILEGLNTVIEESQLLSGKEIVLKNRLVELQNEILMYSAIGQEFFSKKAIAVNGVPDLRNYNYAFEIINKDDTTIQTTPSYTPQYMKRVLEKRLKEYGFLWDIIISDKMVAKISVEPDLRKVFINSKLLFSPKDIVRLQVHEIDTHVLRAENGSHREFKVFTIGTSNSLIHEEGLAIYNEYINDVLDLNTLKLYAARFLCCVHIDKSFYELFDMMVKLGFSQEVAIYVVSRIKRGLRDTKQPGGFNKDYVYLQGFKEVERAFVNLPSLRDKMYYGIISLEDISLLYNDIIHALDNHSIILPLGCKQP